MFSRAWHQFHVFPRLAPVSRFPALGISCTFFRAWYQFHVLPRLAPVARFPALGTSCTFSRAWHQLHILPRLAPVAHFPALGTSSLSSRARHRLHIFLSSASSSAPAGRRKAVALVTGFPALGNGFILLQTVVNLLRYLRLHFVAIGQMG